MHPAHTHAGTDGEWVKLVFESDPGKALDWGKRSEIDWGGGRVGYGYTVESRETSMAGSFKFRLDGKSLSFIRDHGLGLEIHGGGVLVEGNTVSLHHFPECDVHQCGSSFVKNEDGSLSPENAAHLVLGWGTVTRDGDHEKSVDDQSMGLTLVPTSGSSARVVMNAMKGMRYVLCV